jgi:hypothetical protein
MTGMTGAPKGRKPRRTAGLIDRKMITDLVSVLIRVAGLVARQWVERGGRL